MMMVIMWMMQVSVTSFLLILGIFCSSAWARAQRRAECDDGDFACGPGAPESCIPREWLCDGDNDCGDGSDEETSMCANLTCPSWEVTCEGESPRRRCVSRTWLCDGSDQCGNNWDEEPETCGLVAVRNCMNLMHEECFLPVRMDMINEEMWEKIVDTSLRGTCGPVLAVQECATTLLSSSPDCQFSEMQDHPRVIELQRTIIAANITVNYVCRDHVQVFDKHKECLLRRDEDKLVIVESVQQQCQIQASTAASLCPSRSELECVDNVVHEQCGEDIAGHLLLLQTKVMTDIGCGSETHKRYKVTKKEIYPFLKLMHREFP